MSESIPAAGLISPSDVADLAGKSRAAVSYWRKNEESFPPPIGGTPSRPLFDRAAIESWLSDRGTLATGPERQSVAVWAAANALRGELPIDQIAVEIHRLLALRKLAFQKNLDELWPRDIDGLEPALRRAQTAWSRGDLLAASRRVVFQTRGYEQLYRAIADLHESDLAGAGDFALQRVAGASPRSGGGAGAPNSVTAQILVSAARGASGMVYDPACGIAQALLTLAGSKSVSSAVGIEIDEAPHFIATVRGLLRDRDARLVRANTLTEDPDLGLLADTIILEPPFGIRMDESDPYDPRWQFGVPPKSSADLAWVQHAVFHLAPGGAAYVLTPVGALFRGGREAGIRKQLLRADVVQAVVELPPRLLTYTSIGLALWVLRPVRASNVRARVAVIDATEQSEIAERIGDWLDGAERGQIAGVPHAFVDVEDVSSDGAVLSAARWVERAGVDARVVFATREAAEADLAEAIASVASLRTQPQIELEGSQRTTTMKELRTYEFGTLRQGSHNSSGPKSKPIPGLVSPRDVRDGLPRLDPASVAAAASAGMPLTEPGDVLFTTMGTVRAVVDHEGGRIPAKGVWVLHLDTSRFDPAFVAASISAKWNGVHQRGNSITHAVVNDLEIPVLPLEQQRRVAAELTRLDQSARQARALADAAERAAAAVLDVVRFGGDAR